MIPTDFIQTLLSRVDIVEVIDRYVPLKKAGANYVACCPFHSEKTPSFSVSPSKQFYHCFGCGAHGTAVGFLMEYGGKAFPDAVEELARDAGLEVPRVERPGEREKRDEAQDLNEILLAAAKFYRAQLKDAPRAIDYLKSRGLTGEVAARFGIGYAPDAWQGLAGVFPKYDAPELDAAGLVVNGDGGKRYDRFRDRVMFPIHDSRGRVIGFGGRVMGDGEPKYLNSPETPVFSKGRELYGLYLARNAIRDAGRVVVVEGYMDVVALAQHGVEYAVATLGTATTPTHVQKLFRLTDTVVFCFDGDNAGPQGGVARAGKRAAGAGRRQERRVPVPARRRGSGRLCAQARARHVRAGAGAGGPAVGVPAGGTVGTASADFRGRPRRAGRGRATASWPRSTRRCWRPSCAAAVRTVRSPGRRSCADCSNPAGNACARQAAPRARPRGTTPGPDSGLPVSAPTCGGRRRWRGN